MQKVELRDQLGLREVVLGVAVARAVELLAVQLALIARRERGGGVDAADVDIRVGAAIVLLVLEQQLRVVGAGRQIVQLHREAGGVEMLEILHHRSRVTVGVVGLVRGIGPVRPIQPGKGLRPDRVHERRVDAVALVVLALAGRQVEAQHAVFGQRAQRIEFVTALGHAGQILIGGLADPVHRQELHLAAIRRPADRGQTTHRERGHKQRVLGEIGQPLAGELLVHLLAFGELAALHRIAFFVPRERVIVAEEAAAGGVPVDAVRALAAHEGIPAHIRDPVLAVHRDRVRDKIEKVRIVLMRQQELQIAAEQQIHRAETLDIIVVIAGDDRVHLVRAVDLHLRRHARAEPRHPEDRLFRGEVAVVAEEEIVEQAADQFGLFERLAAGQLVLDRVQDRVVIEEERIQIRGHEHHRPGGVGRVRVIRRRNGEGAGAGLGIQGRLGQVAQILHRLHPGAAIERLDRRPGHGEIARNRAEGEALGEPRRLVGVEEIAVTHQGR